MLSAISPGPPLHPHLSLTDGGDDVQSDVALLRARGWTGGSRRTKLLFRSFERDLNGH